MSDAATDLYWNALNYRTAATQHAEEMWRELEACVERRVAAARLAALEEAARMLDREHKARKHIDNHAAFYARKIRELAIHVPPTCTENREK